MDAFGFPSFWKHWHVHDEKLFLNGLTRCPPTPLQQKIYKDSEIQRDGIFRALSFRLKNFPQNPKPLKKGKKKSDPETVWSSQQTHPKKKTPGAFRQKESGGREGGRVKRKYKQAPELENCQSVQRWSSNWACHPAAPSHGMQPRNPSNLSRAPACLLA